MVLLKHGFHYEIYTDINMLFFSVVVHNPYSSERFITLPLRYLLGNEGQSLACADLEVWWSRKYVAIMLVSLLRICSFLY